MKFSTFQNQAVFDLLNKLFAANLPVKVAYKLSKIQKVVGAEAEKYQELRAAVVKKYGNCDESGELIVDENGGVRFEDDVVEALVAELNDLHDIEFDLPVKINIDELGATELTAYDISLLEILEILEE